MLQWTRYRKVAMGFWTLAIIAIAVWSQVPGYVAGWDLRVYENAVDSLRAGHDPYLDGIAVQRVFHAEAVHAPDAPTPFTYVYSPITLPLLRMIARLPKTISASIYWSLYFLTLFCPVWVSWRLVQDHERPVFALLAPAAVFFPGLLSNDVLFSGNIAYIFYGLAFLTALRGWKYGEWIWFYAVVLASSCFKAPMLTLLAIPVFSARRQMVWAGITGALGLGLFLLQPAVWPTLFRHYLEAVELQFSFNHDFSSSPAGLLANVLYNVVPYKLTSGVFYVLYALAVVAVLSRLSRRFLAGSLLLQEWAPVLLVGVILLNPRIMEYDVAPLTLIMALVLWRVVGQGRELARTAVITGVVFAVMVTAGTRAWRPTECVWLVMVFVLGSHNLITASDERAKRGDYDILPVVLMEQKPAGDGLFD